MPTAACTPFIAALLAGGKSIRMGRDKALLPWRGSTLLTHQLATLAKLQATKVCVCGRAGVNYDTGGIPLISDDTAGQGPLGGITTLLRRLHTPHLLVLAVDMPLMTPHVLSSLLSRRQHNCGVIPVNARGWEPLAAVYPKCILPLMEQHLVNGDYALQPLIKEAVAKGILCPFPIPPETSTAFRNCNHPAELEGMEY